MFSFFLPLQVDAFVDIKRPFIKNLWGVQISYTFRSAPFFCAKFFLCPLLVYYFARGGETLIELLSCLFNLSNDI